ncbi:HEAT repeat-containing protein [Cylindrospermum stagnale PCC 7417]|uniref:HEAT repeat-containing protein n=1 Tax=Cylindrospermum stagnale PCC 7417 TaxID=56107 RepID=K9X1Y3_9NOST|nr:HEAT repeat domain-containing protein [Cylindrospermum stagnale]AFZ25757.1 HEAT repeat-containing protein [Cylindrospermum stagnale PCC 7417]
MVKNLNQLLEQVEAAYNAADWSLTIQYLQQLISEKDSQHPEIEKNREYLLKLTLSILEMGNFQQRWDIAHVLGWLGNIAIPSLIDILEDEDAEEELRWYAVRHLGKSQHPDAIASLVQLIKTNQNDELKLMAAVALGRMGNIALAPVCQLLEHEDTRLLAVLALSYNRRTETITPLLSVVDDPQAEIRTAAIEALSSFHDRRVPPVLLTAVDDVAATVRRVAVSGLGFRPDLREALDLVGRLQPRLYDAELLVRSTAVLSMYRMGCDQAAKELFLLLTSPHTPISLQLEIIRALSWLGTNSSLEYLQQALLQSSSQTLWQEIVTVLGRVRQPQLTTIAAEILLDMLQALHPATEIAAFKCAIALSLGQLGKMQAIEPLILLLADTDSSVRLHAIAALKNLAPEVAHQRLQQLANSPIQPDLQQGIAIALAEW